MRPGCIVAGALLGGFGLTSLLAARYRRQVDGYHASFSSEQRARHEAIVDKRRSLTVQGVLLGLLLALLYCVWQAHTAPAKAACRLCTSVAIVLGTTYFYYVLSPKGARMLQVLRPDQVEGYLAKQRAYELRWNGGLLLGALGALVLGRALE